MPESQPPAEAALLVMSNLKRSFAQRRFCAIAQPFALTALADVHPRRSVEPSGLVTIPTPDHCPDNPRNGPPGPVSAYPCAGASIPNAASTPHRPSMGFKQ